MFYKKQLIVLAFLSLSACESRSPTPHNGSAVTVDAAAPLHQAARPEEWSTSMGLVPTPKDCTVKVKVETTKPSGEKVSFILTEWPKHMHKFSAEHRNFTDEDLGPVWRSQSLHITVHGKMELVISGADGPKSALNVVPRPADGTYVLESSDGMMLGPFELAGCQTETKE